MGGALICYFGREGRRLFGGGRLLERGCLFEEIQYDKNSFVVGNPECL